ncbi:MAG: hypothetical protein JO199_00510 [Candidatus Eremiobacteraeota bacterium]|nr:hypothetical protein [Candidatus Eremiobacteraeota bacterium]
MPQPIVELDRLVAISPEPHSIATDGETMWIASRATRKIDVVDPERWTKTGEIVPPGMPWGMTYADGEVVMTCGEPPDDNRFVRRYALEKGFISSPLPCPEDSGSHLAVYQGRVLLGQWYNKQLLLLDEDGNVVKSYLSPHEICGVTVINNAAYALTTDDEDNGDYWITRIDLNDGSVEDVALVPFRARGLAWDGERFWTNHREADRTVVFSLPA